MKKTNKFVQKIKNHYVSDDCVQVMIPYQDTLTIINQDGILYHHKPGSSVYINKYLEDERRKLFPYSNIPTHYSRIFFKKITYTNQILDFEKPYIRIGNGFWLESYVVKDNNQALLISVINQPDERIEHMTYDELLKFIGKSNNNDEEEIYYVSLSGALPINNKEVIPSKEEIHNYIRKSLSENVTDFKREISEPESSVGRYLRDNPWFIEYVDQNLKNIDYSSIDFNYKVDEPMLIVRINNGNITIQGVEIIFVKEDDYKVNIYDIPVTKYSLEQLKGVPKINITREPRIPLRLNPGVNKQDIKEAKQMIKKLNSASYTK